MGRTALELLSFCNLYKSSLPLQTRTKQLVVTYRVPSVGAGQRGSLAGTAAAILARQTSRLPSRSRSVGATWGQVQRSPVTTQNSFNFSQNEEEIRNLRAQLERSRQAEWETRQRMLEVERALGGDEKEPAHTRARGLRAEISKLRATNGDLTRKLDEARAELRVQIEERSQHEDTIKILSEKNSGLETRVAELEDRLEKMTARWERGSGQNAELEELRRRVKLYEEQRLGSERYVEERVRERLEGMQALNAENERFLAAETHERLSGEEGVSRRLQRLVDLKEAALDGLEAELRRARAARQKAAVDLLCAREEAARLDLRLKAAQADVQRLQGLRSAEAECTEALAGQLAEALLAARAGKTPADPGPEQLADLRLQIRTLEAQAVESAALHRQETLRLHSRCDVLAILMRRALLLLLGQRGSDLADLRHRVVCIEDAAQQNDLILDNVRRQQALMAQVRAARL